MLLLLLRGCVSGAVVVAQMRSARPAPRAAVGLYAFDFFCCVCWTGSASALFILFRWKLMRCMGGESGRARYLAMVITFAEAERVRACVRACVCNNVCIWMWSMS